MGPLSPLPLPRCTLILGRGPFTVAGERALIARHRIDVIVSKSSGGDSTSAKLAAARECALPVVMIRRPPPEPGAVVETPTTAAAWVIAALDGPSRSTA
jgi:precorrin-6A/cobalt-precorrin-6A reductase